MHSLIRKQILPMSLDQAWEFFSSLHNLGKITPPSMNFQITSDVPKGKIYPGIIITYKVSPLLAIPINWVTEITQVKEKEYFVDSQLYGPYHFWHHEHWFQPSDGGVLMTDILHYAAPFGPVGALAEWSFVNKKVNYIFDYRQQYGQFERLEKERLNREHKTRNRNNRSGCT